MVFSSRGVGVVWFSSSRDVEGGMVWFLERCRYSLVSLPREMLNMVWFWVPREMLVQFDFFLERRILPPTPLEVVQHLSRHTIRLSRR